MSTQPSAAERLSHRQDRRHACPGLSRMVMAKDGAIARIRLPLGRLSADKALALANIASEFGNGVCELSIRSNLQLRGIAPQHWDKAVAALYEAGLGADNPAAEDIRNVMTSPTAGIDHGQLCDITPLARKLLSTLEQTAAYHALSPKFSFQIDGGEDCAMISHPGDIWFSAAGDAAHYGFGLASSPDKPALGMVEAANVLPFIEAALHLFLAHAQNGVARMKQLFEIFPPDLFLRHLAAVVSFPIKPAKDWHRKQPAPFAHLGRHEQADGRFYIGAQPLMGRLYSSQLKALAAFAEGHGDHEIRLTPWQGVLLPNLDASQCTSVIRCLQAHDLAIEPRAPQARLRACSGMTGCASALTDTQADGRELASKIGKTVTGVVHLTGCTKSCAALAPLPHTLLARSVGRYDLFAQDKAGPSRFGRLLATDITIDEAARLLNS
ncbi:precorrin-3B synthase [Ochrobactrum sp. CM-21-5]|nr:precorrin-3B synthase [Ochrobactrum sp. CM-21-5]MBC2885816.1 precorrin-3B synthase [Ochrobactrum sp. CM-21-5]